MLRMVVVVVVVEVDVVEVLEVMVVTVVTGLCVRHCVLTGASTEKSCPELCSGGWLPWLCFGALSA